MRMVDARGGCRMPALGLGTWKMGEDAGRRKGEVAALRLGFDLGMTLVDTAEIYGKAEEVTGEAIKGRRDDIFVVTKVHQTNSSRGGTVAACEASLKRLATDRIDLYLLHNNNGPYPLDDTFELFDRLRRAGKIIHYGVSNFDEASMEKIEAKPLGRVVTANQLRYSLARRGLDNGLLAWHGRHQVAVMAYTPLEEGFLKPKPGLAAVARRHGVSPMVAALAWVMRDPMVVVIPKASNPAHVRENVKAAELRLSAEDLAAIDRDYPRPPLGTFDTWTS